MIKLKKKKYFERYNELCEIAKSIGLDKVRGLDQYLHLIQGMRVAEDSYAKYVSYMHNWLKNIENCIIKEIEQHQMEKENEKD